MVVTDIQPDKAKQNASVEDNHCFHCGTRCLSTKFRIKEKLFCCEGCKLVYTIINESGLCDYYSMENHPGLRQVRPVRKEKYSYLDDAKIISDLFTFTDGNLTIVTLHIPGIHCSSCLWLLEHLNRLDGGIAESRINFSNKEVTIHFYRQAISFREVVELLATIGYEPYISLENTKTKKASPRNKKLLFKLGVAGFCFGNIMMLSLPEYLGTLGIDDQYRSLFRYLNLVISLPAFFFGGSEFFVAAWKGIRQRMLNIDAPVSLAIIICFVRSLYEIFTATGPGFLDSMAGIIFFMLVGRLVQERAYRSLSFHRDYQSYFPIAVTVLTKHGETARSLPALKENDQVILHHEELIPGDGELMDGDARIDYSFVTGEATIKTVKKGETLYAGGRQTGGKLLIRIKKPISASYLTSLWNHQAFRRDKAKENDRESRLHTISKYFTLVLLVLVAMTAAYWWLFDASKIFISVTAMLIIACPCALLLAATYTNGNLLRLLSNNGLYLRDATVIEQLAGLDHIVFDKTGTLTDGVFITSTGATFTEMEKDLIYSTVVHSSHPVSKAIAATMGDRAILPAHQWKEHKGYGIKSLINDQEITIGSAKFLELPPETKGIVHVRLNGKTASFFAAPQLRNNTATVIQHLNANHELSLLSGDNSEQQQLMSELFPHRSQLLFEQAPTDKLRYIEQLQQAGKKVAMIGDGLNDAGALQQSNVGITLSADINNFTPACDAILDAKQFGSLPSLFRLAAAGRRIIRLSFCVSILYNTIGLFFAVQGKLSPLMAAILMPLSTLTIVLITTGISTLTAMRLGLRTVK